MDNIANMVGNSSIASFIYYLGLTIISVFVAGWFLNGKLRKICQEGNESVEKRITDMENRLTKHELEAVKVVAYERDMANVVGMIKEIKNDVKDGFINLTERIDNFSNMLVKGSINAK